MRPRHRHRPLSLLLLLLLPLLPLHRLAAAAHPQEPKPPFPYSLEEVHYETNGVKLAGTLTLPSGAGPFPAVLLLTGSGAQNRDEEVFGHKPFLVIADHLTRAGIAVLRMDDRGIGGSTGSVSNSTTADFADDALAGVRFLKSHPHIAPGRIGLLGHSEGGIIAPLAASRSKDVAFVILLAGTGLPGAEVLLDQGTRIARAEGAPEGRIQTQTADQRKVFELIRTEKDPVALRAKLRMSPAPRSPGYRRRSAGRSATTRKPSSTSRSTSPSPPGSASSSPTTRGRRSPTCGFRSSR